MTDELLSLRVVVATRDEGVAELFRQAASASSVPIEMIEVTDAAAAAQALARADLTYIDGALPAPDIVQLVAASRAVAKPPFSVLLAARAASKAFATDAIAGKPSRLEESRWLLERSMRVRLPSRALVVDDSATMRAIVRKALAATRFQFHVTEAEEGFAALELVRDGTFDIVFLDYNMPGFSGLETLSELKRENRRVHVVMISSAEDANLAERARRLGAAFLKKPFFPADLEAALCGYYGLRMLNPKHA